MLAFRTVVSVLLRALGDFSLHPQAGPAGGRLRRPSSAGRTARRLSTQRVTYTPNGGTGIIVVAGHRFKVSHRLVPIAMKPGS
jgi:hypothetical protein